MRSRTRVAQEEPMEETMSAHPTRHLHQSDAFQQKLLTLLANEQPTNHFPFEQDRLLGMGRRAKAIIKGDPREFMG